MNVTYTGTDPLDIADVGAFIRCEPGATVDVPAELAARLLDRDDFTTPKAKKES